MDSKQSEQKHLLKRADALALVKKLRGAVQWNIHCRGIAPVEGEEGSYYETQCGVTLDRKQALKIIGDFVSDTLEAKGARVPLNITVYEGERFRDGDWKPTRSTSVWIG
jgi:hypothetical protein